MGYRDNITEVLRGFDKLSRSLKRQTLTFENNMEYASHLQNKEGYYVFSDEEALKEVNSTMQEVQKALPLTPENVQRGLDQAGHNHIAFLRSLTSQIRPPTREVRDGEGVRRAHPGGWADITTALSGSYRFRVNDKPWQAEKPLLTP